MQRINSTITITITSHLISSPKDSFGQQLGGRSTGRAAILNTDLIPTPIRTDQRDIPTVRLKTNTVAIGPKFSFCLVCSGSSKIQFLQ
jgi:hypothetical protein